MGSNWSPVMSMYLEDAMGWLYLGLISGSFFMELTNCWHIWLHVPGVVGRLCLDLHGGGQRGEHNHHQQGLSKIPEFRGNSFCQNKYLALWKRYVPVFAQFGEEDKEKGEEGVDHVDLLLAPLCPRLLSVTGCQFKLLCHICEKRSLLLLWCWKKHWERCKVKFVLFFLLIFSWWMNQGNGGQWGWGQCLPFNSLLHANLLVANKKNLLVANETLGEERCRSKHTSRQVSGKYWSLHLDI